MTITRRALTDEQIGNMIRRGIDKIRADREAALMAEAERINQARPIACKATRHGADAVIERVFSYQPKGSMCASCSGRSRDCSRYDFSKMIKISKADGDGVVVVKCSHYENIKDAVRY